MEAKAKGNNKDKHDEEELEHGEANVLEHEDEDAKRWKLLEVGEKVEPSHGQDERPNRPTPALRRKRNKTFAWTSTHNVAHTTLANLPRHLDVENKANGEEVDHPIHHVCNGEVTKPHLNI